MKFEVELHLHRESDEDPKRGLALSIQDSKSGLQTWSI